MHAALLHAFTLARFGYVICQKSIRHTHLLGHPHNINQLGGIWDRMFGTAYDPGNDEWPRVGVAGLTQPRTVRDFLLLPTTFVRPRMIPLHHAET